MPAQDQGLDRQEQRLDAQDHGMHQADRVDGVEAEPVQGAEIRRLQCLVVAGIGVGDTTAALGQEVKLARGRAAP